MRRNYFGGKPPVPVVEREVHDFMRLEHLQKYQIRIASVFHVMTRVGRNEADVVSVEVHGTCRPNGHKHSHSPLPRNVELPLRGIWMPMELAETSWLYMFKAAAIFFAARKLCESTMRISPPGSPLGRRHRFYLEGVLDGRLHFLSPNCCPILRQ